jgi:hypothetical protein
MGISPRKKFYRNILIMLAVGWLLIFLWAVTDNMIFLVLMFGWVFVGSSLVKSVRCPKCDTPVGYWGKIGPMSINTVVSRGQCRNCGCDLTKPEQ